MFAKEVATSGIWGNLREAQRVCEDSDEAVPTAIAEFIEFAREGVEIESKNAKLSNRNTDMKVKLVEARAAKSAMRCLLKAAERQATALKVQLADAELALEKLAGEIS